MSGRTLMVGQVWEHWSGQARIRIDGIDAMSVKCAHVVNGGGRATEGLTLLIEIVLRDYLFVGTLGDD